MSNDSVLKRYFGTAKPASPDDVEPTLWNSAVRADQYAEPGEKYQAAIMDQYKLYVEMADRISVRRGLANTFFLTLNAAIFTVVGVFWKDRPHAPSILIVVPFIVAAGLCLAWFWLVRSYRQLNSGKFAVIGAFERRLPASPYWAGEWKALGEGRSKAIYWPLTHLEQWVPLLFGLAYLTGFLAVMFS